MKYEQRVWILVDKNENPATWFGSTFIRPDDSVVERADLADPINAPHKLVELCKKDDELTADVERWKATAATEAKRGDVLQIECDRLKKLSVENIMLDIVPGWHGEGVEVYAKSVDDVVDKLGELGDQLEEWILGIRTNFVPAAVTRHVNGSGPNDVGIEWRGGFVKDGIYLYRLKSSI